MISILFVAFWHYDVGSTQENQLAGGVRTDGENHLEKCPRLSTFIDAIKYEVHIDIGKLFQHQLEDRGKVGFRCGLLPTSFIVHNNGYGINYVFAPVVVMKYLVENDP